ncbi:MAG: hypothetical protein R3C44_22325 [Chloroflexota bacterium]
MLRVMKLRNSANASSSLNANNGQFPRLIITYTVDTDTTPPVSSVDGLPQHTPLANFTVSWSAPMTRAASSSKDAHRVNGDPDRPQTGVTSKSEQFPGGDDGSLYEFLTRAIDNAGNIESDLTPPQAATTVITGLPIAQIIPFPSSISYSPDVQVSWEGQAADGVALFPSMFSTRSLAARGYSCRCGYHERHIYGS